MDIQEIEKFMNYTPVLDSDPQIIVDKIIRKAKKYLPEEQLNGIQIAYEFARDAHAPDFRLSGEAYIIHPLKAAIYLMQIKPDLVSIQSCILHDVIEDTDITYEDIEKVFGNEVADICESLVKVSKIRYRGEDRHLETLKKTFLAMAKDLRVIFIKLADRIHNIQTLEYHPNPEKRIKIADETLKIYVPIAKRLGLFYYQLYLENGSFRILNPEAFDKILVHLKKYFGEGEKYTEKGIKLLTTHLHKNGITDFEVKGRIKSPYRIFQKLENRYQNFDLSMVMDLIAFRVITKSVVDCYMVLGIIHNFYTPLIKKIKDYIAVPKFNGYKSIHTTVLGMFRFPVEVQIRTYEMDDIAEYGVAAHFLYSENNASSFVPDQQNEWIKRLQRIVDAYKTSDQKENFKDELNIEILSKGIYVYTPQGDVIELSHGSTVLDFAFSVHSEIGLKFKNALVNREIKPISYRPKTGDIININTFKNKYTANKHRLEFIHTPSAKSQLIRFLRNQDRNDHIERGIINLNKNLKELGLPNYNTDKDMIHKIINNDDIEKRLIMVMDKKDSYMSIIKSVYPEMFVRKNQVNKKIIKDVNLEYLPIIVDSNKLINCTLCAECKPNTVDKIIAKSSKYGIKIHTIECKALKTISLETLLEAHWEGQEENIYTFTFKLKILNQDFGVMGLMNIFSQLHILVSQFNTKIGEDGSVFVTVELELNNPTKAGLLFKDLKKYSTSIDIIKVSIL